MRVVVWCVRAAEAGCAGHRSSVCGIKPISSRPVSSCCSPQRAYEVTVLPGEASRGSERARVLDFSNAKLGAVRRAIGVEDGLLKQSRTGQFKARTARVVLDLASVTGHHVTALDDPRAS